MSTDGGSVWVQKDNGYFATGGAMVADPNTCSLYWSGGDHNNGTANAMSVSKTTNSGSSWTRTDIGTDIGRTQAMVIDPSNSDIVYAGGDEDNIVAIYKTTNGGSSWLKLPGTGLSGTDVFCLAIDPNNTDIIYAGTSTNLYKSIDAGQTWNSTNCPGGRTNAVLINYGSTLYEGLYAGTQTSGVYFSTNGGSSWQQINDGLDDLRINCLSVSQAIYVYAGTQNAGIYRWSIQIGVDEEQTQDKQIVFFAKPNPTSKRTTITYQLENRTDVNLSIYDIQGRLVRTLVKEPKNAGEYTVVWDGFDQRDNRVAAGVYFYKLATVEQAYLQKLVILK